MKFSFTEDQRLFASGLRDLLANECTPAHVREAWENHTGHIPELWSRLTDMGVLSMLVPESAGGMGGTLLDAILLFQELGRAGVPGPVLEHMAIAAPALANTSWGPSLVDGSQIATLWVDNSPYVAHAHVANLVLRNDAVITGFSSSDAHGIDGGRQLFTISGGSESAASAQVFGLAASDVMALASAAYLIGASERMIEVEWSPSSKSVFLVQIQIEALDRSGLLSDVTRVLSEHHVNILSATVSTSQDRLALSRFVFEMSDVMHLDRVLNAVRRIDAVYDVYRVSEG